MNPIYCKYSNDRDKKFQIKTTIELDNQNNKYVCKYPTSIEARNHVEQIYLNYKLMEESFKDTIFQPNKCTKQEGSVRFEFINGKTFEDYLDNFYAEGQYLKVVEEIKKFTDILYSLTDNIQFEYTDEFENVFGKNTAFSSSKSLKISNIDLIFGNILLGEKWTIIDYEWTFNFPIPIEYIIYRALYYYIHGNTKRSELISLNIFKLLNISDDKIDMFNEMELNFQKYVAGNKTTIPHLKQTMLKRRNSVFDGDRMVGSDYLQVYFDKGNGYDEKDFLIKYYNYSDGKIYLDIDLPLEIKKVRIHPASAPAFVCDLSINIDGRKICEYETNGYSSGQGNFAFCNNDPQIEINNVVNSKKILLSFYANDINSECYSKISKIYKTIDENHNEQNNLKNEVNRLHTENQNLTNQCNSMINEYNNMAQYIQRLHSRKVWRALSISKRTLKSVKRVGVANTIVKGCKKVKHKISNKPANTVNTSSVSSGSTTKLSKKPSNKAKVLVVVHEAQKAGATLLSMNIIQTIKSTTDYEPIILLMSGGPLTDEFKKQGICFELNQLNFNELSNEIALKNIVKEIVNLGVKYALCNSVITGLVLKELHDKGIKTITMVHELTTSIKAYNFINAAKNVQKYSDDVVFAAKFVKKQFVNNYPVDDKKCHVIPQGVYSKFNLNSLDEKINDKNKLCKQLGISIDSKIVMGCGYGNFRKGLDWFGLIAINEMIKNKNVHFVWLGNKDKEFAEWINNDLLVNGVSDRFHWMDFIDNPGYIFGATDIFLLTSREDPFPSVALEAMKMYAPVVAFENAGGIPELLVNESGVIVPYGECDKMVDSIEKLLADREMYNTIVKNAKKAVMEITPDNYIKKLLGVLVNGEIPYKVMPDLKVSVVIPNYNYENFIPERLSSILNQTVKPYEIVFLDDVSKDNSIEVADKILKESGISYRIIANKVNQGCFKQWLNGVHNAKGDIIWIAEADDVCETDFIESLLPFFDDDQVNIAYGQSEVINEFSEHSGWVYTEYTDDLNDTKWHDDYVNNGEAEIIDGLGIKNTIPNASGVLMRKSAFTGIEDQLYSFAISGDWFAYVYLIKTGKIAFTSRILNYHRRHSTSIIHKREQDIKLFVELMRIKLFMAETFMIPESIKDRFVNHVKGEYTRLMSENAPAFENQPELVELQNKLEQTVNDKINKYKFLKNCPKKNLLFIIPDFEMGGGQTLVIRLANYFSKFHNVYLYNARPCQVEERIVKMISERVTILESNGDPEQLKRYIKQYKIDTINDHIWWADKMAYKAAKDLDTKIVLSMHGCYEALLQHPDWDEEFTSLAPKILNRANEIIYATNKNKKIFETVPVLEKTHLIHYGYELESIPTKNRASIGIDEDSFVFGLVARGIKEKGFGEAAQGFKLLLEKTNKKMDLVLIGNGTFIDGLKELYKDDKHIHFVDNLNRPSEWIGWVKTFDCALLPTYFVSESLPNSVIEYLAYNKPVISTDIGDIKHMINYEGKSAGILLDLHDGTVDAKELSEAMLVMVNDEEKYLMYKENSKKAFEQFDIRNFAENYYSLY